MARRAESVEGEPLDLGPHCEREMARRIAAVESGKAKWIPLEAFLPKLDWMIAKHKAAAARKRRDTP